MRSLRRVKTSLALGGVLAAGGSLGALALAPAGRANGAMPACQPSTSTTPTTSTTGSTTTTSTTPSPPPIAPPQGRPLNNVTVENCTDGTIEMGSSLQVGHANAQDADPANFAYAYAHDCNNPAGTGIGCEAVAAAFQVVLVPEGTHIQTPQNIALAVNDNCNGCAVFAFADQYAVNVPPGTHLTWGARWHIRRIRDEVAQDVANTSLPFTELDADLKALAAEEHTVVDDGLRQEHARVFRRRSSQHIRQFGSHM